MYNQIGNDGKSIFAPEQARYLLKNGGSIIDIKPDKRVELNPAYQILLEELDNAKLADYILYRIKQETNLFEKTIFIFDNNEQLGQHMTEWRNNIK